MFVGRDKSRMVVSLCAFISAALKVFYNLGTNFYELNR